MNILRFLPPDHANEIALIEMSRIQRETLERWMVVCVDAGETDLAEEVRREISRADVERAA